MLRNSEILELGTLLKKFSTNDELYRLIDLFEIMLAGPSPLETKNTLAELRMELVKTEMNMKQGGK